VGAGLVALAVVVFALFASYGITSPFYYGHYGYHGGSHATWARGTLRHHTIYPVNEPGFAAPNPQTYYIHHPVLTHQFVTLTFALFGQHEWSVRLGALISSFACLLLVTAIAWRYLGPLAGGAAALVFAFVPVNVWYAPHMDPGFPSIACLLAFFWFYLRWLDTGRWRTGLAALAFELLAGGFEWSPYVAFLAIFPHVVWTGWRRRGRYLAFAALHPIVVVLPLALHFLAVWHANMLNDLLAAYRNRTSPISYREFANRMGEYGDTLFGRTLLIAMVAWLVLVAVRMVLGRGRVLDLIGVTFAFSLITYMHIFKTAVVTHAYRQLYGNVWAALAVADLAVQGRWLGRRLLASRPKAVPYAGLAAALCVVTVATVATLPTSWAGLIESRLHGGVPGWKVFNPDLRQTAFAIEVERMTTPKDLLYFHTSFAYPPPYRMEWAFYYDRDLRRRMPLRQLTALSPEARRHAVAIFFPIGLRGDELRAFGELASRHPVFQVQDLAAIDLRTDEARVSAYDLAPVVRAGIGIRGWLDGPYPFPKLLPDPSGGARLTAEIKEALKPPPPPPSPLPRAKKQ
jgi:hypothetical protein